MKKLLKKALAMGLALCMLCTSLPMSVLAVEVEEEDIFEMEVLEEEIAYWETFEEDEPDEDEVRTVAAYSDTSGGTWDCTWAYNASTQTLTISGDGAMGNMSQGSNFSDYTWGEDMKTVIFEEGVNNVGSCAFYGCDSLSSVIISDSVSNIGSDAFGNCTSLASITIPDGVSSIEGSAFDNCTSLTSITIGDGVTSIGTFAFLYCTALEAVYITDLANWCEISFSGDDANPLSYAGALYLNGSLLKELVVPNSVTSIGSYAFYGYESLTDVTIGNGVTGIGSHAFQGCDSLTNVIIGNDVASIGWYAFYGCGSLESVTIGDSVESIENSAFHSCKSLERVYITDIANWCAISFYSRTTNPLFYADALYVNGTLVEELIIPDGVTSIGTYAFCVCESLTTVVIPDSVTSIGVSAFYNCDSLTNVTIGDSVTSIGSTAFGYCDYLSSVTIGDSVTSIENSAFLGSALTSVIIPDSVTSIGDDAFYYCTSLDSITIGGAVTSIGEDAFSRCDWELVLYLTSYNDYVVTYADENEIDWEVIGEPTGEWVSSSDFTGGQIKFDPDTGMITDAEASIQSADIPSTIQGVSVIGIDQAAFMDCTALIQVTLPSSMTIVDAAAFKNCTALQSILIPNSVTYIGNNAFQNCSQVTIYGASDSIAEAYATENNIPFVSLGTADEDISGKFSMSSGTDSSGKNVSITTYFYDLETTDKLTVTDFSYTNGALHVALDGYYTIDISNYTLPDSGLVQFPLVPTSTNTYISAVLCNGQEALGQDAYAYTADGDFTIEIFSPSNESIFTIKQDSSTLITSGGSFNLDAEDITTGKALSVQAGSATALTTKIVVKNSYEDLFVDVSFGDKISFTIPDDVPIIGGGEIKLDFTVLPVYYTCVDNTMRLGIGIKQDVLTNETDWINIKKFIQSNQESIIDGDKLFDVSALGAATMGPKGDVDMEVYGFVEGSFDFDGSLKEVSGNLIIKLSAKVSQEWQTAILSVPVVIKASLGAEIESQSTIGFDFDDATLYMGGELDVVLPSVKLSAGVGVSKIADLSVYGAASNNVNVEFDTSVVIGTLKGELGVSAKVLFVSAELPLLSGSWQYYHSGVSMQNSYAIFSAQTLLDETSYSIDRSNLATQSAWLGAERTYSTLSDPTMNDASLLQSSVYANANPLLAETDDGTQILVGTADIADRTDGNHTAIVYSINSGGTWSEPVIIQDDGTADFYPTITTSGDDVYVAWMNANQTFDADVELTALSAACEITVATLSDGDWTYKTLTNDSALDVYPNLNTVGDTVYLVWTTNSENDILSMTGTNTVCLSSNADWKTNTYFAVSNPITEVEVGQVGQVGNDVVISYIMVDDDISLYAGAIGNAPTKLATGDFTGSGFETLDGTAVLFWNSQDSASYTSDLTTITDLTVSEDTTLPEFIQILTIGDDTYLVGAIGTDENGMYSYQLDDTTVGNGVLMLDLSDRYLTSMSAVQGENGLDVVYLSTEVTITADSVDETPDIYIASLTPYADVSLVSGYYETDTDTGVPVVLTLENTGLTTITAVTITATQGDAIVASSEKTVALAPGAQQTVTIEIPHDLRDGSDIDYTFTVTLTDDVDATNDSLDLTVGLVDVSVATTLLSGGEAISATVAVANEGDLDTIVMLNVYEDDTDGALLATYRCGEIAANTTEYFQVDDSLLSAYAYQDTSLCFAVESLDTEEILFNNVSYEYVSQGRAAIAATLESVSSAYGITTGTVTFSTNEVGCMLIAACYANGQMVDSAIQQVAIGQMSATFSLSGSGTNEVVVYILDENWEPLVGALTAES